MSTTAIAGVIIAIIAIIAVVTMSAIKKTTKNEKVEKIADEVIDKFTPIIKEELPAILENAALELDYNTYKDKIIKVIAEIVNSKASNELKNINTAIAITKKVFENIGDDDIADQYVKLVDAKNEEIVKEDERIAAENESLDNGTYESSGDSYGNDDEEEPEIIFTEDDD